jgi:hypothetical protein
VRIKERRGCGKDQSHKLMVPDVGDSVGTLVGFDEGDSVGTGMM